MGRKPGELFRCSCGEQCVMVPSQSTGILAPITTTAYEGGNVELIGDGRLKPLYRIVPKAEREADPKPRLMAHFANCPDAGTFRR